MTQSERKDFIALEILKLIIVTFKGEDPKSAALTAYEYANAMEQARNNKKNEEL